VLTWNQCIVVWNSTTRLRSKKDLLVSTQETVFTDSLQASAAVRDLEEYPQLDRKESFVSNVQVVVDFELTDLPSRFPCRSS
jgi:hypothetical protein